MNENMSMLLAGASGMKKEIALKVLLKEPDLLDPLLFILFTMDAGISDLIKYDRYKSIMKAKAIGQNNKKLLEIIKNIEAILPENF
jgi:hypothetical protein